MPQQAFLSFPFFFGPPTGNKDYHAQSCAAHLTILFSFPHHSSHLGSTISAVAIGRVPEFQRQQKVYSFKESPTSTSSTKQQRQSSPMARSEGERKGQASSSLLKGVFFFSRLIVAHTDIGEGKKQTTASTHFSKATRSLRHGTSRVPHSISFFFSVPPVHAYLFQTLSLSLGLADNRSSFFFKSNEPTTEKKEYKLAKGKKLDGGKFLEDQNQEGSGSKRKWERL